MPTGSVAQPAWGFRDRSGRFFYEFYRVYGAPDLLDEREPTCQLDEGRSYWVVTWAALEATGDERAVCRWMTYAEARKRSGSGMTFRRFSSLLRMSDELPELLGVRAATTQQKPAIDDALRVRAAVSG